MKNRGWKKAETRFARAVGSERKPCDGSRDGADFEDGLACYQLKVRAAIPSWLWDWLTGIQGTARRFRKVGVLVLKHPKALDDSAIIVLSWADWKDLHGNAAREREQHGEEEARTEKGKGDEGLEGRRADRWRRIEGAEDPKPALGGLARP